MRRRHDRTRLNGGFGAAIAVSLISVGTLALSVTALGSAAAYSDSVDRDEQRVQASLNAKACDDTKPLIKAKDSFVTDSVTIPEFNCMLNF